MFDRSPARFNLTYPYNQPQHLVHNQLIVDVLSYLNFITNHNPTCVRLSKEGILTNLFFTTNHNMRSLPL